MSELTRLRPTGFDEQVEHFEKCSEAFRFLPTGGLEDVTMIR